MDLLNHLLRPMAEVSSQTTTSTPANSIPALAKKLVSLWNDDSHSFLNHIEKNLDNADIKERILKYPFEKLYEQLLSDIFQSPTVISSEIENFDRALSHSIMEKQKTQNITQSCLDEKANKQADSTNYQHKIKILEEELIENKKELEKLRTSHTALLLEKASLENKTHALQSEVAESNEKAAKELFEAKFKLKEKQYECSNLSSEVFTMKSQLEGKAQECLDLQKEIANLLQRNKLQASNFEEISQQLSEKNLVLTKEVEELKGTSKSQAQQIKELENDIQQKSKQLSKITQEYENAKSQIRQITKSEKTQSAQAALTSKILEALREGNSNGNLDGQGDQEIILKQKIKIQELLGQLQSKFTGDGKAFKGSDQARDIKKPEATGFDAKQQEPQANRNAASVSTSESVESKSGNNGGSERELLKFKERASYWESKAKQLLDTLEGQERKMIQSANTAQEQFAKYEEQARSLRSSLSEKNFENGRLSDEIAALKQQIIIEKHKSELLERRLAENHHELEEAKRNLEIEYAESEKLKLQVRSLKIQLETQERDLKTTKKKAADFEESFIQEQRKSTNLTQRINEIEKLKVIQREGIETIKKENQSLKASLISVKEELAQTRSFIYEAPAISEHPSHRRFSKSYALQKGQTDFPTLNLTNAHRRNKTHAFEDSSFIQPPSLEDLTKPGKIDRSRLQIQDCSILESRNDLEDENPRNESFSESNISKSGNDGGLSNNHTPRSLFRDAEDLEQNEPVLNKYFFRIPNPTTKVQSKQKGDLTTPRVNLPYLTQGGASLESLEEDYSANWGKGTFGEIASRYPNILSPLNQKNEGSELQANVCKNCKNQLVKYQTNSKLLISSLSTMRMASQTISTQLQSNKKSKKVDTEKLKKQFLNCRKSVIRASQEHSATGIRKQVESKISRNKVNYIENKCKIENLQRTYDTLKSMVKPSSHKRGNSVFQLNLQGLTLEKINEPKSYSARFSSSGSEKQFQSQTVNTLKEDEVKRGKKINILLRMAWLSVFALTKRKSKAKLAKSYNQPANLHNTNSNIHALTISGPSPKAFDRPKSFEGNSSSPRLYFALDQVNQNSGTPQNRGIHSRRTESIDFTPSSPHKKFPHHQHAQSLSPSKQFSNFKETNESSNSLYMQQNSEVKHNRSVSEPQNFRKTLSLSRKDNLNVLLELSDELNQTTVIHRDGDPISAVIKEDPQEEFLIEKEILQEQREDSNPRRSKHKKITFAGLSNDQRITTVEYIDTASTKDSPMKIPQRDSDTGLLESDLGLNKEPQKFTFEQKIYSKPKKFSSMVDMGSLIQPRISDPLHTQSNHPLI